MTVTNMVRARSNSTAMDCATAVGTHRRGPAFQCLFLVFLDPASLRLLN